MAASLESAFEKLRRADEHLNALQAKIGTWFDSKPYSFHPVEQDVFFPVDLFHFKIQVGLVDPPPWDLAVTFGDALVNLRGALDHAFFALVTQHGTPSEDEARNISFPISYGFKAFMKRPGIASFRARPKVKGKPVPKPFRPGVNRVTYAERLMIQRHQPYHRKNAATHPLAILRRLNDLDKHRSVHPMLITTLEEPGPKIVAVRGEIDRIVIAPGQPLEYGAYIADVWIRSGSPNPDVDVELIPVAVAFGDSPRIRLGAMEAIREEVGVVLAEFLLAG